MSNWITITPENILGRLAQSELEEYQAVGNLSDEETPPPVVDKLAEIIGQVTTMVRGKVLACQSNERHMGPAGTIPKECLFAACTIARNAFVSSLPINEAITDARNEETRQAHSFLDAVARCEVALESSIPISAIPDGVARFGGDKYLDF